MAVPPWTLVSGLEVLAVKQVHQLVVFVDDELHGRTLTQMRNLKSVVVMCHCCICCVFHAKSSNSHTCIPKKPQPEFSLVVFTKELFHDRHSCLFVI
jgi:hypothetical protein